MVYHDLCTHNLSVLAKHFHQIFICKVFPKVLDVNICKVLIVTEVTEPVLTADELAYVTGGKGRGKKYD